MSSVFLSYSHKDGEFAKRLVRAIRRTDRTVSWDQRIRPGDRWRRWIHRQIDEASCVVVLWSDAANRSPEVLHEARRGQAKLVPATLDGKIHPEFASIQTVDLRGWAESEHAGLNALIEEIERRTREVTWWGKLKDAVARLAYELLRPSVVAAALSAAVLASFLFSLRVFDILELDTKLESVSVYVGGAFRKQQLSDRIALIAIDPATEAKLGAWGPSWRALHARLLNRLAAAKARVVAFDVTFASDDPTSKQFADAIEKARRSGTAVVVGADTWDSRDKKPRIHHGIRDALGADGWGIVCIGMKRGLATVAPLAVEHPAGWLPSLAVAAVAASQGLRFVDVDSVAGEILLLQKPMPDQFTANNLLRMPISVMDIVRRAERCPILAERHRAANSILDLADLQDHEHRYEDVLRDERPNARFAGKIVLVGRKAPIDLHRVWPGRLQYGFELHAQAINGALRALDRRWIRPISRGQFAAMFALAALAAWIRLRTESGARRRGGIAFVLVAYTAAATYSAYRGLIFNFTYGVAAVAIAYAAAPAVRKLLTRAQDLTVDEGST